MVGVSFSTLLLALGSACSSAARDPDPARDPAPPPQPPATDVAPAEPPASAEPDVETPPVRAAFSCPAAGGEGVCAALDRFERGGRISSFPDASRVGVYFGAGECVEGGERETVGVRVELGRSVGDAGRAFMNVTVMRSGVASTIEAHSRADAALRQRRDPVTDGLDEDGARAVTDFWAKLHAPVIDLPPTPDPASRASSSGQSSVIERPAGTFVFVRESEGRLVAIRVSRDAGATAPGAACVADLSRASVAAADRLEQVDNALACPDSSLTTGPDRSRVIWLCPTGEMRVLACTGETCTCELDRVAGTTFTVEQRPPTLHGHIRLARRHCGWPITDQRP